MPEPCYPSISPFVTGVEGRCPRCGRGRLFRGFIDLAPQCLACGLDFDFVDAGDGPAVFVSFGVGLIVVGAALWFDIVYEPWVHLAISLPLVVLLCLGLLRPLKGLLVALQYRHRAEQGRVEP